MKVTPTEIDPQEKPPVVTDVSAKEVSEVKDSRYTSLDEELPSRFSFYSFQSLGIRPFTLMELKKLFRAHTSSNFKDIVDVIGATIDRNVYDLTVGDFWFLMYWQRINSYKKSPMTVPWTCEANDHVLAVELDRLLPETLKNTVTVNKTTIRVVDFDIQAVADFTARIREEYGVDLFPGTIRDVVAMVKLADKVEPDDDWIAKYATNISPDHGATIQERMKFLENMSQREDINAIDFIYEIEQFVKIAEHGVRESITSKCKECDAEREVPLTLDAHSFFPSL